MIISHKHKFIYFKAKKVAGTSTEILLSDLVDKEDIVTPITKGDSSTHQPRNYIGFRNHSTPNHIRNKIGENKFNSYYKFISIRNPFDRVVSWYWWQNRNEVKKSFRDFVLSNGCYKLSPFSGWIFHGKKCVVDDYIRYENLENDTKRIFGKWFDDDIVYPTAKSSQRKEKKHYTEYYDDETRQIVAEQYAKDIKYFGYKFGV
jgi:hypothetical protein|tara:strand:- start:3857 stop:4465 length:609 start_codon:yes stop_codon:yes gene_type:complete